MFSAIYSKDIFSYDTNFHARNSCVVYTHTTDSPQSAPGEITIEQKVLHYKLKCAT